jgi:dinuclear metal center YbgI/SA1388 family protein
MGARVADLVGLLEEWYDPASAEPWDAVGLVCGDPDHAVERVLFAVDPAPSVVAEALEFGADLIVVHHPLLLTPVHGVAATTTKGRIVHDLVRNHVALFTAHTNADVEPQGVNEALALALGLGDLEVVQAVPGDGLDKIVVFVPEEYAEQMRTALHEAGAGGIGGYDHCTFTSRGEGRFRPLEGARPTVGQVGRTEVVHESRVESVLPRSRRREVVAALRAVHPYEEPAYDLLELAGAGDQRVATRGHGRVGVLPREVTLREFAAHVGAALPHTMHGVRVAGDPGRPVRRVAVASGSGDYLLDTVARLSQIDALVTSDLRHHRAGEFLEDSASALVDVAHWAAEWTWLPVVERRIVEAMRVRSATVETRVSTIVTDPWTFRV